MAQPSTSSPERAAQGEGRKIPIEDARTEAEQVSEQGNQDDTGSGAIPPTSPRAAASAAPAGSEEPAAGSDFAEEDAASDDVEQPADVSPEEQSAEAGEEAPSADDLVAKAQAEAREWQDKFMRLHAEWDTYRRRTAEQREAEKALATEKLVSGLIPVIDDFERTIDYAENNGETGLFDGVKAVHAKFVDVLSKGGVQVIDPAGEAFDALEAQAVATVDDASVPDETVGEVYQKGYKMGSKVLRPAMVTVTTGGPKREKPQEDADKK